MALPMQNKIYIFFYITGVSPREGESPPGKLHRREKTMDRGSLLTKSPINKMPHPAQHGSLDPIAASHGPARSFWPWDQPCSCQPAPLWLPLGGGSLLGVRRSGLLLLPQSPTGH
ncbi:hypothetical protein Q9966_013794 [Columba livia]|nr:hypothetical protein Q9966_013794 [Columba livia]